MSWCINAKNLLKSVHGFSSYELATGHSTKLPSTINNKAPAPTSEQLTKVVSHKLHGIHKAKETFIASENSETFT